jgi:hypothetical protein
VRATAVITCMGRLAHLKRSLPLVLEHTDLRVVVVDWSCPDGCGVWISNHLSPMIEAGRLTVVGETGHRVFNKPAALNFGLRYAAERWPGWLCVLDADTLVTPALGQWLNANVERGRFYFVEGYKPRQDLSGLLVMHSDDYEASGGYDESFAGWGGEDWDMRCRLYFKVGLPYVEIPCALADSIAHGDAERTRFYEVKNKHESHHANQWRIIENVRRWTGQDLRDMKREEIRRLFGMRAEDRVQ